MKLVNFFSYYNKQMSPVVTYNPGLEILLVLYALTKGETPIPLSSIADSSSMKLDFLRRWMRLLVSISLVERVATESERECYLLSTDASGIVKNLLHDLMQLMGAGQEQASS